MIRRLLALALPVVLCASQAHGQVVNKGVISGKLRSAAVDVDAGTARDFFTAPSPGFFIITLAFAFSVTGSPQCRPLIKTPAGTLLFSGPNTQGFVVPPGTTISCDATDANLCPTGSIGACQLSGVLSAK
jgi:hypothetical protein